MRYDCSRMSAPVPMSWPMQVPGSTRPENDRTREKAARNRAAKTLRLKVIKRDGRYRLVEFQSKLVSLDQPMTLDTLKQEILRLEREADAETHAASSALTA